MEVTMKLLGDGIKGLIVNGSNVNWSTKYRQTIQFSKVY